MGISFGKNRKIKIKVNKSDVSQAAETKTEISAEKTAFQPKAVYSDKSVQKANKLTFESVWQDFFNSLSSTYNITGISVYTCVLSDMYRFTKLYGDTIQSSIVLEKYFSFGTTTVLTNATGLTEERNVKSRYITNLRCNDRQYLLVLSSRAYETFTNRYAAENITILAKNAVRKIGELL